jgi:hypothetical protein
MGNRSKRGRRDAKPPDPVAEWQEEARWSGFTRQIRWPFVAGSQLSGRPSRRMPPAGAWLGIAAVVAGALGAVWLVLWLTSLVL